MCDDGLNVEKNCTKKNFPISGDIFVFFFLIQQHHNTRVRDLEPTISVQYVASTEFGVGAVVFFVLLMAQLKKSMLHQLNVSQLSINYIRQSMFVRTKWPVDRYV